MVKNVLIPRCSYCNSDHEPDLRCSACKVTRYCSSEHQSSDWGRHKSTCHTIKRCRRALDVEDTKLRNDDGGGGGFGWAFPFENYVGHFWGVYSTRPYMRARFNLVAEIVKVNTHDAATAALGHLLDMLRLCRGDNQGVRDLVPALYLRLNRDQECYDFSKWYQTEGIRGDYNWGDMNLGFLDLKNEDVMESAAVFCDQWGTSHAIPVTLMKVRMLLDLRDLATASALLEVPSLNPDAVRSIQDHLDFRSPIWKARPELLAPDGLEEKIRVLEQQTDDLFKSVNKGNEYFWKSIFDYEKLSQTPPHSYSNGTREENVLLLMHNGRAWDETEGAMGWVLDKLKSS
ncbi:hypothetical protein FA15DRAFT_689881 [Coprinopsis marcescibilis]|uniref:MYND-type domain-containing protein n=1 Tax=Coprinopsis marcescibilis TaxID=230819 RepID=A0A5C3KDG5_COPMA|nr:hypothetical protein FA15DRAFT_689881 [Coprinopsis marcescibilis]